MSFVSLPPEIHFLISSYLPPHALLSTILTSRRHHALYLPALHTAALTPKGNLPALHWSITRNHIPLTLHLLRTKPTLVNTPGPTDGWTALHYAAAQGRPSFIPLLLTHGADPRQRDYIGATPLDLAPSHATRERFEGLRRFAPYHRAGDRRAVDDWHVWPGEAAYEEVSRLLVEAGADVDNQDFFGRTALFWAARVGALGVLRVLVGAGADVDLATRDGETAVMAAVAGCVGGGGGEEEDSRVAVVKVLVGAGADLDVVQGAGLGAVAMAVLGGARRCVRVLTGAGTQQEGEEWGDEEIVASGRAG